MGARLPDVSPAADEVRLVRGQVDEQEFVPQSRQDPARPLHVHAHLVGACRGAHVHGVDHVLVDHPVGVEAVARLKELHRLPELRVVRGGGRRGALELPGRGEPRSDRWNAGITRPRPDRLPRGNPGPSRGRHLAQLGERPLEAQVDEVGRLSLFDGLPRGSRLDDPRQGALEGRRSRARIHVPRGVQGDRANPPEPGVIHHPRHRVGEQDVQVRGERGDRAGPR